jgi:hypothetical protein
MGVFVRLPCAAKQLPKLKASSWINAYKLIPNQLPHCYNENNMLWTVAEKFDIPTTDRRAGLGVLIFLAFLNILPFGKLRAKRIFSVKKLLR